MGKGLGLISGWSFRKEKKVTNPLGIKHNPSRQFFMYTTLLLQSIPNEPEHHSTQYRGLHKSD